MRRLIMKQTVLFFGVLVALLIADSTFGQTPYWQPVNGPFENITNVSLIDSMIATKIGSRYYSYDAKTGSWTYFYYETPRQVPWPYSQYKAMNSQTTLQNDTAFFANGDTVFFTSDFGLSWKRIGTFGSQLSRIFELTSGAIVLQNSVGKLYYSYNAFRTFDSGRVVGAVTLQTAGDTLFYIEQNGNVYRSNDIGKHWDTLLKNNDGSSNRWHLQLFPTAYVVYDLHGYLSYSRDGGKTFHRMHLPADSILEAIEYGAGEHLYAAFLLNGSTTDDIDYRSDDWGQTWKKIKYYPQIIDKNGTVYYYYNRSSDFGDTWQMLTARGLVGIPNSMESWKDSTYLSTEQGIFKSTDEGLTWFQFSSGTGVLGLMQGDTMTLNTIYRLLSNGFSFGRLGFNLKKPDIGAIMGNGMIWVRDGGHLMGSVDTGASYYDFSPDNSGDMKNFLALTTDTALVVFGHGVWKAVDLATGVQIMLPGAAQPSGALTRDSSGAIYLALNDGSIIVSHDSANTWQTFASPISAENWVVTNLAAANRSKLWAVARDTTSKQTLVYAYDPFAKTWTDVTRGADSSLITNVWYVGGYTYAGTANHGLFRSVNMTRASVMTFEAARVSIAPNPVSQWLIVSCEAGQEGSISVLDITGREVLHSALEPGASHISLDCNALPSGIYFLRLTTGRMIRSAKFVKD
jgi:hypothetical protein